MFLSRNTRASFFWLALFSLSLVFGSGMAIAQDEVDLDNLLQEAQRHIGNEEYAAAAKKLKQVTKAEDDNGMAWQLLGYSLHLDGKLDDAIVAHAKAAEFPQFEQLGLYNLGCAYSLKNEPAKSLKFLHKALDAGFNRFEMFESDSDLDNVKKADGFKEIQARAENDGNRPEKPKSKPKGQKGKTKGKSLVGKWTVTSGERQGNEIDADRLPPVITIRAKDLTIPAGEDEFVMSYKVVDASKGVIKIDFKIESGPTAEGTALGIMKFDGNKATLCCDPMGQNRPEQFKTSEENGCFMFVLEKKVKKSNASKVDKKKQADKKKKTGKKKDGDKKGDKD